MADTETMPRMAEEPDNSLKRKATSESDRRSESPKRARRESTPERRAPQSPAHSRDRQDSREREKQQDEPSRNELSRAKPPTPTESQPNKPRESPAAARARVAQEEKKRGQRLFGGLLGTLSQRTSSAQQQKRLEIEKRQQERLKQLREEEERVRVEKRARLEQLRAREGIVWQEKIMKVKHGNWRELAEFLKTSADPVVYYKPWILTKEQKDIILRQQEDVEEDIRREVEEFEVRKAEHIRNYGPPVSQPTIREEDLAAEAARPAEPHTRETSQVPATDEEMKDARVTEHGNDHQDESGDVLVEGGEDVVLY